MVNSTAFLWYFLFPVIIISHGKCSQEKKKEWFFNIYNNIPFRHLKYMFVEKVSIYLWNAIRLFCSFLKKNNHNTSWSFTARKVRKKTPYMIYNYSCVCRCIYVYICMYHLHILLYLSTVLSLHLYNYLFVEDFVYL